MLNGQSTKQRSIPILVGILTLLGAAAPAGAQCDQAAWSATLDPPDSVTAAGVYQGGLTWNLETFSPLELEPSETALFEVVDGLGPFTLELGTTHRLLVHDTEAGLSANDAGAEPFFVREEGAITATGWVDQPFCDLRVEGDVNTEGGPGCGGSSSRQGLMARWDKGNNFYWFFLNFASGQYAIWRSKHLGEQITLDGSVGTVAGFDSTRPYRLRFKLSGDTLRGQVFSYQGDGSLVKVGDTGDVTDADPHLEGVSGFLAELAMEKPFGTLDAGFANLSSTPLLELNQSPVSQLQRARRALRASPDSYVARYDLAAALDECGDAAGALEQYDQVLDVYPDHVPSLNGKAWLLATAEDPALRKPSSAVDLALEAFNQALQSNNTRHDAKVQTVYSRPYMVELGYTLGAAYAAQGRWDPIDDILGWDTNASGAIATVEWALELAQAVDEERSSRYSQELVDYGERALDAYLGTTPLYGERRPGSGDGVGSCSTTQVETTSAATGSGVAAGVPAERAEAPGGRR